MCLYIEVEKFPYKISFWVIDKQWVSLTFITFFFFTL